MVAPTDRDELAFGFRPWVRRSCVRALVWGSAGLLLFGVVAWQLRSPDDSVFGRAFLILFLYTLLFWLSLFKIWWTAGAPAVTLDSETLAHQPLHLFRPRRIRYGDIVACAPRQGTESLRFVIEKDDRQREFFLNLAVVRRQHELLDALGERLVASGLLADAEARSSWRRPGWQEPEAGG